MKIVRAKFENFRLLRKVELDFSTDPEKRLSVIRAENETGKTTILTGLQWALYGDGSLPDAGEGYRLHPIDWDANKSKRVPVSVEVDFETVSTRNGPKGTIETTRTFRIIRSAIETLRGATWERVDSGVKLFHLTEHGAEPIDPPEAYVDEELPRELREVFFTDGDRALSFIESSVSVSTKRDRVSAAIRSLLGLAIVEDSIRHVKKAESEANRRLKTTSSGDELSELVERLGAIDDEIAELEDKIKDARIQFGAFDEKLVVVQKKIDAALIKGDREKLKQEIEASQRQLRHLDEELKSAAKEHSSLFRLPSLCMGLASSAISSSLKRLDVLRDQGKIPNATIPVLEERLKGNLCICGESLESHDPNGSKRRQHIQQLIDQSREADELQGRIADLYYGAKTAFAPAADESSWDNAFSAVAARRDELEEVRREVGERLRAIEVQLDGIPDTDIQTMRKVLRDYSEQRDRFNADRAKHETNLDARRNEKAALELKRDSLLRLQEKGSKAIAEIDAARDIEAILMRAYSRITNEELSKVSELMNRFFLEMIGSDPEQGAIIQKAEISPDFDIMVFGPNERTLNPDRDLNGASRRALTLSFVLALTKVSEVEAPNVIDTPLGMMSGYVKRSVLEVAVRESSQLILFLTRSEIRDCEELIDEYAGKVLTLTNSAHYPTMLKNKPEANGHTILRCECDHRSECKTCARRLTVERSETESRGGA